MTERLISAELRGEVRRRDDERRLRKVLGVSGDEQGIVALRGKSYAVEDSVVRVGEPKIVGLCNCVNVRLCNYGIGMPTSCRYDAGSKNALSVKARCEMTSADEIGEFFDILRRESVR